MIWRQEPRVVSKAASLWGGGWHVNSIFIIYDETSRYLLASVWVHTAANTDFLPPS